MLCRMNKFIISKNDTCQQELLSNTISFIKFPLAVLVITLHTDLSTKLYESIGYKDLQTLEPVYMQISWLLSRYLAYAAVPIFFIISGFLLFYNVRHYNKNIYISKIRKRVKSLLVPYVLWNLIYLTVLYLGGQKSFLFLEVPDLFNGKLSVLQVLLLVFIRPLDGPLWFVRNLFGMALLSPLLYWIIRKTKFVLPITLFVFSQIWHNPLLESILWFSCGVSFAIWRIDFFYCCRRYLGISLGLVIFTVVLDYILYPQLGVHVTRYFSLFKIILVLGTSYYIVEKRPAMANIKVLNEASFVLYAYHGLAIMGLLPQIYLLMKNCGGAIVAYFIAIFIITLIGVILSLIINKNKLARQLLCGR